eukprot:7026409-Prymnesium_polylepis.1
MAQKDFDFYGTEFPDGTLLDRITVTFRSVHPSFSDVLVRAAVSRRAPATALLPVPPPGQRRSVASSTTELCGCRALSAIQRAT